MSVRLSQENLYIALLLLHDSNVWLYNKVQNSHSAPSQMALFIHILFSKVHPNGIRCFYRRHHTVCAVRCIAWLPTPTVWNYFCCFWCYFFSVHSSFDAWHGRFSMCSRHRVTSRTSCEIAVRRWTGQKGVHKKEKKYCRDEILLLTVAGDGCLPQQSWIFVSCGNTHTEHHETMEKKTRISTASESASQIPTYPINK